ncbi:uncharacterized protein LOC132273503 [Cornus florida]|uniref:uncharacterized protein LOC132273503 n=1 Tax=Cornus florida TaxID=4283 RepID=UPI00289CA9D9|nr:uncharacterized protein LOC132273503 [Cornus florida]
MVMEGAQEADMGDGNAQCTDHPYKNNTPGGICAFCLQEKLGKLVSSSFPIAVFPSSSSSSSPSFRSDFGGSANNNNNNNPLPVRPNSSSSTLNNNNNNNNSNSHSHSDCHYHQYHSHSRRSRLPFLLTQKKKKKKDLNNGSDTIVFKRSKSTATPRRGGHFLDAHEGDDNSPHRRGFWSFLYLPKHSTTRKISYGSASTASATGSLGATTGGGVGGGGGSFSQRSREKKKELLVVVDENESPNQATFDGKVSRSRSLGCGSRSFSGDFFERISTGFGDCTLRRVESQREGKSKVAAMHRGGGGGGHDCIKERVKCGGIFSGFMITSSSSSSSSSSYWVSSEDNMNGKSMSVSAAQALAPAPAAAAATATATGQLAHGRSKSWGWAFASPIRAFSKPSSGKREASNKNTTPNLAAIPSLLAVRG